MEELNCETVFYHSGIWWNSIAESVVVSWIIMAVLTILSICLVRNLKVENPGRSSWRWKWQSAAFTNSLMIWLEKKGADISRI